MQPVLNPSTAAPSRFGKLISWLPFLGVIFFHLVFIIPQFITPGEILRMSDFIFPSVDNQSNFNLSYYAWTTYGLGQPSIPSLSMGIVYFLSKIFGTPFAQQFFGFSPLLVASIGMYFFLIRSRWMGSRFWAAVISILYVINWAVFSYEGDHAALLTVTGLMWTYAVAPYVMLFAYKIFVEEKFSVRNVMCLALFSLLASLSNSQALVVLAGLVTPFIVYHIAERIVFSSSRRPQAVARLVFALAGWGTLCGLLIFPVIMSLVTSVFLTGNVQALYGVKAALWPDPEVYRFLYPYPISLFLVLSSPRPFESVIELMGLCVPALAILGICWERDRRTKLMALLLFAAVLFLTGWVQLIFSQPKMVEDIYKLPILGQLLQVLRNPLKFFMFLGPFVTVLMALGVSAIFNKIKIGDFLGGSLASRFRAVACVALVGCAVFSIFFNHKGRVFHLRATYVMPGITDSGQGGLHALPYGRLNKAFVEITKQLYDRGEPRGRTLWVPNENEIWSQTTQVSYENILSYPSSLTMGIYQQELVNAFGKGTPETVGRILSLLKIRFIVVVKYSKQAGPIRIWGTPPWGEHIVGDPMAFLSFLDGQDGFAKLREDDSFAIYENTSFH